MTKIEAKAFEWAVATTASKLTGFAIDLDGNSVKPSSSFEAIEPSLQASFLAASHRAIKHLIEKETAFFSAKSGSIRFLGDAAGKSGDVRDLVISNGKKEVGISCKNNHADLKHSRLSDTADFVKDWGLDSAGCSQQYWSAIKPIFAAIRKTIKADEEATWAAYPDKIATYWGILDAWRDEVLRYYGTSEEQQQALCQKLITYLFGTHDFYKIILRAETSVDVQSVNFRKTLMRPYAKYPTVIRAIDNLENTRHTRVIAFNNGFSINFKIHNTGSKLSTSLKLSASVMSLPTGQFYQRLLKIGFPD